MSISPPMISIKTTDDRANSTIDCPDWRFLAGRKAGLNCDGTADILPMMGRP
jgi:hypothetical protein